MSWSGWSRLLRTLLRHGHHENHVHVNQSGWILGILIPDKIWGKRRGRKLHPVVENLKHSDRLQGNNYSNCVLKAYVRNINLHCMFVAFFCHGEEQRYPYWNSQQSQRLQKTQHSKTSSPNMQNNVSHHFCTVIYLSPSNCLGPQSCRSIGC